MNTYFVEVNAHFLVRIELEGSCAAAEHHFLDTYQWVWAANAYDVDSMNTDCFRAALLFCEIVSEKELIERLAEVCDADMAMTRDRLEFEEAVREVERLEKELAEARERKDAAFSQMRNSENHFDIVSTVNRAVRPQ